MASKFTGRIRIGSSTFFWQDKQAPHDRPVLHHRDHTAQNAEVGIAEGARSAIGNRNLPHLDANYGYF